MTYNLNRKIFRILSILVLALFSSTSLFSSEEKSEKFEPGSFIIEHILDSYGWHITTIGEKEIAIPLPVILFDEGKPVAFMSSKFHHGSEAYKGYALGFTENTQNKVIKLGGEYSNYTGEISEELVPYIDTDAKLIDISITKNVCALLISVLLISILFFYVAKQYKVRPNKAPKGLQSVMEMLIVFVTDEIVKPSIGEKHYLKYCPYLLTLFFFIFLNNVMGLIPIFPGGANLTGNIAVTAFLAIITFLITTFSSGKSYWAHIINTPGVPWWLKFPLPIMPIVELVGVFTKPFVLMIRLFANISGGHIIVIGFISLIFIFGEMAPAIGYGVSIVSIFFYIFMGLLELIVAFVQAFVFTLLSAMYIGMARENHQEHKIDNKSISTAYDLTDNQ